MRTAEVWLAASGDSFSGTVTDGCGAPVAAISLTGLARAFGRLAAGDYPAEARVADAMAGEGVSIAAVRQEIDADSDGEARLGITTHVAPDARVRAVVRHLESGEDVRGTVRVLRVEGA